MLDVGVGACECEWVCRIVIGFIIFLLFYFYYVRVASTQRNSTWSPLTVAHTHSINSFIFRRHRFICLFSIDFLILCFVLFFSARSLCLNSVPFVQRMFENIHMDECVRERMCAKMSWSQSTSISKLESKCTLFARTNDNKILTLWYIKMDLFQHLAWRIVKFSLISNLRTKAYGKI